jgi:hypothetical protein
VAVHGAPRTAFSRELIRIVPAFAFGHFHSIVVGVIGVLYVGDGCCSPGPPGRTALADIGPQLAFCTILCIHSTYLLSCACSGLFFHIFYLLQKHCAKGEPHVWHWGGHVRILVSPSALLRSIGAVQMIAYLCRIYGVDNICSRQPGINKARGSCFFVIIGPGPANSLAQNSEDTQQDYHESVSLLRRSSYVPYSAFAGEIKKTPAWTPKCSLASPQVYKTSKARTADTPRCLPRQHLNRAPS